MKKKRDFNPIWFKLALEPELHKKLAAAAELSGKCMTRIICDGIRQQIASIKNPSEKEKK